MQGYNLQVIFTGGNRDKTPAVSELMAQVFKNMIEQDESISVTFLGNSNETRGNLQEVFDNISEHDNS